MHSKESAQKTPRCLHAGLGLRAKNKSHIKIRIPESHMKGEFTMRSRITTGAIALLLAAPIASHATAVAWTVTGTVDTVTGSSYPNSLAAGEDFSFVLHFDTALGSPSNPGVCNGGVIGTNCKYLNQAPTVEYFSDVVVGGTSVGYFAAATASGNGIFVRNDFGTPAQDGYTFVANRDNGNGEFTQFFLALRGTNDLNLVTDGTVIPEIPPASLASLDGNGFQVCDSDATSSGNCNYLQLDAHITSVSTVPEPATAGLIGLGASALGLVRRRRAKR